jgi:protein-tyrosine phosphatase
MVMGKKILFVCLGNICRSPAAEGIMEKRAAGWPIEVDSAGTAGYHIGTLPDARMRSHASRRGYPLNSRARKFNPAVDFDKFDMIIAMDKENLRDLRSMDTGKQYREKLSLMTDYCQKITADEVPDPYYEGPEGFEHVLDILEDACGGLLKKIEHEPR